tara:strand:- start:40783 stop:40989 length:207 start_codon:yes stop_codon:yes gene_type:complete
LHPIFVLFLFHGPAEQPEKGCNRVQEGAKAVLAKGRADEIAFRLDMTTQYRFINIATEHEKDLLFKYL